MLPWHQSVGKLRAGVARLAWSSISPLGRVVATHLMPAGSGLHQQGPCAPTGVMNQDQAPHSSTSRHVPQEQVFFIPVSPSFSLSFSLSLFSLSLSLSL